MISSLDLAWAAGFLEGEAWFGWNKGGGKNHRGGHVVIIAAQAQREPLDRLQALFGGSIHLAKPQIGKVKGGPQWRWNLVCRAAIGLMFTLYPMLTRKRHDQILRVIPYWRAQVDGRIRRPFCRRGHDMSTARYIYRGQSAGCLICHKDKRLERYYAGREHAAS